MELSSGRIPGLSFLGHISYPFLFSLGVCLIFSVWIMRHVGFYVKAGSVVLGVMMVSLIGMPLYLIWVHVLRKDADDFQVKYVSYVGRFYGWLFGIHYELENGDFWKDVGPCVVVANHQSTFDIIAFTCFVPPRTMVVIKNSMKYIFPMGTYLSLVGNIFIDRKSRSSSQKGIDKAAEAIMERKVRSKNGAQS
jgi:1-acyl-sn-glycerol-3-phosphate acyltransferase